MSFFVAVAACTVLGATPGTPEDTTHCSDNYLHPIGAMEDWDTCRAFAKARKEELELKLKIDALQRGRELKLLMVVADCVDAETAAKFMAGTFGNAKDGT